MTSRIQKQIEESITEKISISEMITRIDRFIKGLKSLNMSLNKLKIVMDLLEKLDTKSRIELIEKLIIMFNPFTTKLNIKLMMWYKNLVSNFAESISERKNLKIRHIDIDLDGKSMAYDPELPFGLISMSEYINTDAMNIMFSDVEID